MRQPALGAQLRDPAANLAAKLSATDGHHSRACQTQPRNRATYVPAQTPPAHTEGAYAYCFQHLRRTLDRASASAGPPHFLLVEDEPLVSMAYRRALEQHGIVTEVSSEPEALLVIATVRLTGIVTDVAIRHGSGLEVARAARERAPDMPILIVSGLVTAERLDAAHEFEANYLLKPLDGPQIARFAVRAIARERRGETLLRDWVDRYGLSAAEAVTLRLAVDGRRGEEMAAVRQVSITTVRTQIRSLLAKVDMPSVAETVSAFYMELADT